MDRVGHLQCAASALSRFLSAYHSSNQPKRVHARLRAISKSTIDSLELSTQTMRKYMWRFRLIVGFHCVVRTSFGHAFPLKCLNRFEDVVWTPPAIRRQYRIRAQHAPIAADLTRISPWILLWRTVQLHILGWKMDFASFSHPRKCGPSKKNWKKRKLSLSK